LKNIKDIDKPEIRLLYILNSLDKLTGKYFLLEHAAEIGRMLEEFFNIDVDTGWRIIRDDCLENQAPPPPALQGKTLPPDYQFIRDLDKKGKLDEVVSELKSIS
jgi:hypothetical protein